MKYLLSLITVLVFSGTVVAGELNLSIPKLKLMVRVGTSSYLTDLELGGAHWSWTPLPGRSGNTVIGGHRTVNPGLFINLDRLLIGYEIIITEADQSIQYRVYEIFVLQRPHLPGVIDKKVTNRDEVTLVTCHPKYESTARLIVRATRLY